MLYVRHTRNEPLNNFLKRADFTLIRKKRVNTRKNMNGSFFYWYSQNSRVKNFLLKISINPQKKKTFHWNQIMNEYCKKKVWIWIWTTIDIVHKFNLNNEKLSLMRFMRCVFIRRWIADLFAQYSLESFKIHTQSTLNLKFHISCWICSILSIIISISIVHSMSIFWEFCGTIICLS